MTEHHAIHTGAGWRCQRCGVSWDQGEDPADCSGDPTKQFVDKLVDDAVEKTVGFMQKIGLTGDAFANAPRYHAGGVVKGDAPRIVGGFHSVPNSMTISYADAENCMADTGQPADPMAVQVGGRHYKDLAIQPTEFAQKNGYDFCSGSILKYLTRHRMKNGVEDLHKARHFVEIRESIGVFNVAGTVISMSTYMLKNAIHTKDTVPLVWLDAYVRAPGPTFRRTAGQWLIKEIDTLIAAYG